MILDGLRARLRGRRRQPVLAILNRPVGLFATLAQVLGELYHCETHGLEPVAFFGHDWPYWSPDGHRGARNGWEYYFAPLSRRGLPEILGVDARHLERCTIVDYDPARVVANHNPAHHYDRSRAGHLRVPPHVTVVNRWPAYDPGVRHVHEDRRAVFRGLIDRWIRPRPEIVAAADAFVARHLAGRPVVGVHVRDAEHQDEIAGWHQLAWAPPRLHMRAIDPWLDAHPDGLVLTATDTERLLDVFGRRYGARCVTWPARRASPGRAPHEEFGGPQVGEEILIEALLLARTELLVHGISNVSTMVLCLAPDLPHVDVYQRWGPQLGRVLRLQRARAVSAAAAPTTAAPPAPSAPPASGPPPAAPLRAAPATPR